MKRIVRIDASCIKDSSCFRRLYLTAIEGYTGKSLNNDIHYGTCFHKCAEVIELTGGDVVAGIMAAQELWREKEGKLFVKPSRKYLTLAHLTMACQIYGQARLTNPIFTGIEYLRSPAGLPLVEQKMSIPLYEDEYLLILLQGTIDGIAQIKNGCIVIADWKTTGSYDKDDYFMGYRLSPQLKTYFYGLNYYRNYYPDSPLGRLLIQDKGGQIGAFIYGAFHSVGKIIELERSEIFWFNRQVMEDYETQLQELVCEIKEAITHGKDYLPPAQGSFNGSCISPTGWKCKFFNACACEAQMNGDSKLVYHYLNSNFKKTPYTPLDFGGGNNKQKTNEKEPIGIESNVFSSPTIGS